PPTANAGADQVVNEGASVQLDGSSSSDPDGSALAYRWTQIAGPMVALDESDPARPAFTAPLVVSEGTTLTFELVVNDGTFDSAADSVNISVKNLNRAPVADAGSDQLVSEGSSVTLDASASFDPDAEPLTHEWAQIGGP